jgi:hypothetical protein
MYKLYILIACLFLLNACAALMAISGEDPNVDIASLGLGSTQTEVEMQMGYREKTFLLSPQKRIDYYKFKEGTSPSISRAIVHSTMSVATNGAWEVLGGNYEKRNNREKYLAVTYNQDNLAIDLRIIEIGNKFN